MLLWEILGGTVMGGLVVAVSAVFIVDWIREGVREQGLQGFWFPIVAVLVVALAVVGGVVLLTVSLISPRGRERWARFGKWLWSWRPISARRHERSVTYLVKALAKSNAARSSLAKRADEAISQVRDSMTNSALHLSTQLNESGAKIDAIRTDVDRLLDQDLPGQLRASNQRVDTILHAIEDLDRAHRALRESVEAIPISTSQTAMPDPWDIPSAPAAPPLPEPRWRLTAPSRRTDPNQNDGGYLVQNLIEGSVARNVRIDNDGAGYFDFEDGAFWADLSGVNSAAFGGEIVESDQAGDVRLRLSYLDQYNRSRALLYWVNRDGRVREIPEDEGHTLYI